MGQQDLSMNEMPVHDHRQDWSDEHVTVKYLGFNRASGEAEFEVTEHHNNVGVYYIWRSTVVVVCVMICRGSQHTPMTAHIRTV
jgi:hypothetical protein